MNCNYKFLCLCILLLVATSCRQSLRIEKINELKDYSAGSGMTFFRGRMYLMGDDMNYLLVTDSSFNRVDTIQLEPGFARIPKNRKSDLEAASALRLKKTPYLLLLGSGSVYPYRFKGWLINLFNTQKTFINLEYFYKRIQASGIKELNIEGVTAIPGGMILSNRGNKSYPKNSLIFTSTEFWNNQQTADIRVMKVGATDDTASFKGVSGLDYSYKSDCLLLTVSTENTYSAQTDGSIGKSYLWLIDNISSKKRLAAINPTRIIDLELLDDRFRGHKIESVCILSENKTSYQLVLVADDDKGTSLLFKIKLNKKD
jgi:hypothetical protein